jgi:hypothetical protein
VFLPLSKYTILVGNDKKTETNLLAYKRLTYTSSRSFIFSREFLDILTKNCTEKIYLDLFEHLLRFGNYELFVVDIINAALISMNMFPFSIKYEKNGNITNGTVLINLMGETNIPLNALNAVKSVFETMNIVLSKLVPELKISITELGKVIDSNGNEGYKILLVSHKNSKEIPLRYESEGIKKIVSVLQLLIVVYNNASITVAIDELDSGVFEYLLGELLKIVSQRGRGQLIFTSHNLRPLETLDTGFIAFTTNNPQNRYIRLNNIKKNNNLRDYYYRDIILGNQSESLYESTNNEEIAMAFRQAGEFGG